MENHVRDAIGREALRIEEDSAFSSKSHYNAGEGWASVRLWVGIPSVVIAAVASGSAFRDEPALAGILAAIVAGLTAVSTFLNPSEKERAHQASGAKYGSLRNRARIFREVEVSLGDEPGLRDQLLALASERDALNAESPRIPRRAFRAARRGIEEGEAEYQADRR
ncbi:MULTISPECIES: SLATT domain-containing protein [Anaeromyxobacter]|uniref:SLATT domain-containing protein n=1 Tax=Anaeromyxobacter TaxID=161492 RepID=UPI001F5A9E58|nr:MULTISPECIES: SLATT domain-containing protein [unclassified Anaeromyxobacter]